MPRIIYKNAAGKRLPSVTTILSRFKESGGLIHWAWNLGMEGKDYRAERDKAASKGHLGHDLVEQHIHGEIPELPPGLDEETHAAATNGYEAFRTWERNYDVKFQHTEVPLVSELHQYGGMLDAKGTVGVLGRLFDWKTSNAVYPEYVIQLAAYRQLWNENHPDDLIDTVDLLRFGKDYGDFHHHGFVKEQIDLAFDAFLHLRRLYDLDKQLKSFVK